MEKDSEQLRSKIQRLLSGRGWIDKITGSFKDDPDFEEILRLGREIRQADRLSTEDQ